MTTTVGDRPFSEIGLNLVDDIETAYEFKRWLGERRKIMGYDLETEGFNFIKDGIRLAQFGDNNNGWAIPWQTWGGVALEALSTYEGPLVLHNRPFDANFTQQKTGRRWPWERSHCTMVMAHCLDPARPKGLKPLTSALVDRTAAAGADALHRFMSSSGYTWKTIPIDNPYYWGYGAMDTVLTTRLFDVLDPQVKAECQEVYDLELATQRICANMTRRGTLVDLEYCDATARMLREWVQTARMWARKEFGVKNVTSAMQAIKVFEEDGIEFTELTESGRVKLDKNVLLTLDHPLADCILKIRKAEKLCSTYLDNFSKFADDNGYIHPTIWTCGTRTARMCLAAGTMIDGPRNLKVSPSGTPIEKMCEGDLVYSFDETGTPHVKKVLKTWNHGVKRVLRLVYASDTSGNRKIMELKATPDHRIALHTGEYVELQHLKPGDKLGFLSRTVRAGGTYAQSRIAWNGEGPVVEARYVCSETHDIDGLVVHHDNENPLDQTPGNLVPMTRTAHADLHHGMQPCPYDSKELHHLVRSDTNLKRIARREGVRYTTLKIWCEILGVELPKNSSNGHGERFNECPLTASQFFTRLEELSEGKRGGLWALSVELETPYIIVRRWYKEFCEANHVVIAVIDDDESVPVYDLTIEDTPNFVANELWVHNSITDPAFQTLPKNDKTVRNGVVPDPGHSLVTCDADQIELRLMAHFARDAALIEAFSRPEDFFCVVASEMLREKIGKEDPRRKTTKNSWYARLYGAGPDKIAATAGVPVQRILEINELTDRTYPGIKRFMKEIEAEVMERERNEGRGYVISHFGRKLPVDRGKAYTGTNYKIQCSAALIFKRALVALDAAGYTDNMLLPVHDEIVLTIPTKDAEEARREVAQIMTDSSKDEFLLPITWSADILEGAWGGRLLSDQSLAAAV